MAELLTKRVCLEIISHEAIVREMYLDSKGFETWGPGITSKSGHHVRRYKDNPQTVARCLEVFIWLLREQYLPDVLRAFKGHILTEAQLAAALSFHWNTGAIREASWVIRFRQKDLGSARAAIMQWNKPSEIIERRTKERDLFFDGVWSNDGKAIFYDVRKPSYLPNWRSAKRINISADLDKALAL